MHFELPYNGTVSIGSYNNNNTIINIEESDDKLQPALLDAIFKESGARHLVSTITEDMFQELLDEREDELHQYLINNGYIFEKDK